MSIVSPVAYVSNVKSIELPLPSSKRTCTPLPTSVMKAKAVVSLINSISVSELVNKVGFIPERCVVFISLPRMVVPALAVSASQEVESSSESRQLLEQEPSGQIQNESSVASFAEETPWASRT